MVNAVEAPAVGLEVGDEEEEVDDEDVVVELDDNNEGVDEIKGVGVEKEEEVFVVVVEEEMFGEDVVASASVIQLS